MEDATETFINKCGATGKTPKTPQIAGFYKFKANSHTNFKQ